MKAIQTSYKGYLFRSRLEARWAVFFDALGLNWQYEAEGFDLGEAGWYLPDFRIVMPDSVANDQRYPTTLWVEIKPENILYDDKYNAFANMLHNNQRDHCVMFSGDPYYMLTLPDSDNWAPITIKQYVDFVFLHALNKAFDDYTYIKKITEQARSARFEHGEKP